jgi:hypothetical protein
MPKEERSPLWGLTANTAIIGGAGYGLYQNRSALANIFTTGRHDIVGQAADIATNMTGYNMSRGIGGPIGKVNEGTLQNLARLGTAGYVKDDIKHLAYESLMSGGQTTHKEAMKAMKFIDKQPNAIDAYKAASSTIVQNKGNMDILQSGLSGIGSSRRSSLLKNAVTSSGRGIGNEGFVSLNKLQPEAIERFRTIAPELSKSIQAPKIGIRWKFKNVTDIHPSGTGTITTPMAIGEVAGTRFNVPLANTGRTYGGKNLTSRYITRKAYTAEGKIMTYSDFYTRTMKEALSKGTDPRTIKQGVQQATQTLIEQIGSKESQRVGAAAIWSSPIMTSGGLAKARLISQEAVPAAAMTQSEILDLLGEGLYPYTSSGAGGKGVLTTRNLAKDIYGDLGPLMSAEAMPGQFVRPEWGVTAEAKIAAKTKPLGGAFSRLDRLAEGSMNRRLMYGKDTAMKAWDPRAYTAPQLMTFYAKPATEGYGMGYKATALNEMLSAEEGVISKNAAGMMEYERIVQKKITLDKGMRVNNRILDAIKDKSASAEPIIFGKPIGAEEAFVGIERGTGREIIVPKGSEAIGIQITKKNQATILLRERHKLNENEMWKFFSEENKFMAAAGDERKMRKIMKAAGMGNVTNVAGQEIEAIFSGKLIGRNKMSQINQQIEATSMFLANKLNTGKLTHGETISSFLADPAKALNIKAIMDSGAVDADAQIQKNLIGLTRSAGFSKHETQLTFGMMAPEVAQRLEAETNFKGFARMVERAPGVIGFGKMRLGDLAIGGTGGRGSIEPTGLRLMTMKGLEGQRFAVELTTRLVDKGELAEANKMLTTVLGQQGSMTKLKQTNMNLTKITDIEDFISPKGRYVSLGRKFKELGDSSVLYVPGVEKAQSLMSSTISPAGKKINSPVVAELESFQHMISKGRATSEQLEFAAAGLRNTIARATEAQAFGKGKVLGSAILTGARHSFKDNPDTFRISTKTAQSMFDDLLKRTTTQDQTDFLTKERKAIMQGKTLVGGMLRHPTTGPESFQFVKYRVDRRITDGMVAAPKKFGKLQIQGKASVPIDVSEMVGFKGDFDRDQFVLSAIGDRDTASRVGKKIDHEMRENYNRYLFNHYGMKDAIEGRISKSAALDMTSKEALQAGYQKLTTAKTATGQVNVALQKLKIGLQHTAPEKYRPLAEMFWHLEEAAIGGKHGIQQAELYQSIAKSVNMGGEAGISRMESVIKSLVGEETNTVSGQITDSLGKVTKHQYESNPRKWAEMAIASHDAVSNDVNVAMRSASMAAGKDVSDLNLHKLTEQYYARRVGSIDAAQAMMQAGAGDADAFTLKTSRMLRRGTTKAKGLFRALSKAKGPALVGGAIAAGAMLMAPSISGVLKQREGVGGGRDLRYDDLGPPAGATMNPPPPGPNISPKVYDTGGVRPTTRANIRMRINDLDSSSRDFMRSARELSNGGNVSIRTRDDRSLLDSRSLASKIHERL